MLNIAVLMGRLTADPELRHTKSDISVTTFTLAVDRDYLKQGQERETDFIDIVCWRGTAEFASRYFHKGQLVAVEGNIQTRTYTDSQGTKRKAVEIVARSVHFAEPRRENGSAHPAPAQENGATSNDPATASNNDDFEEIASDDDLPF